MEALYNESTYKNRCINNEDVFSRGPFDMGRTSLVEHVIDTGNQRPIRQGLSRHPIAHLDVIDQQVQELIEHSSVEPVASPRASNVVLLRVKTVIRRPDTL